MTEPMDVDIEVDEDELNEFILNHVVLPRHLPSEKQTINKEVKLINLMIDALDDTPVNILPNQNTFGLFKQLKELNSAYSNNTLRDYLKSEINSLMSSNVGTFGIYLQDCLLLIYKREKELVLATFLSDVKPGSNRQSDIAYHFPLNAIETVNSSVNYNEKMVQSDAFINQLCHFYTNEPGEKSDPDIVLNWLVTVLAGPDSKTKATSKSFPVIMKKLRNERIGGSKSNFFERSHMYLAVKSLLRHTLTMEFGDADTGKFVYKIIMLQFLNQVCAPYTHDNCTKFNIELLSQMIAKIARRIDRMMGLRDERSNMSKELSTFIEKTIKNSKNVIKIIRIKIDQQIDEIQEIGSAALEPLIGLDFLSSIEHSKIPEPKDRQTQSWLHKKSLHKLAVKSYFRYFNCEGRWPEMESITKITKKSEVKCTSTSDNFGNLERNIFWYDFENRVLYSDDLNDKINTLHLWAIKYLKYAKKAYADSQLSASRMVLVCLKMIKLLDENACNAHPLLLEYQTGINPQIIDALLLPQRADMEIACELQKYFEKRNNDGWHPSLIDNEQVSDSSFSVEYARTNYEMQVIWQKIKKRDEENADEKECDWNDCRQRVMDLRKDVDLICPTSNETIPCNQCENCKKLQKVIANMEIEVYERLLPDKECEQLAIVFELGIPPAIACFRDVVHDFVKMFSKSTEETSIKDWTERPKIHEFKTNKTSRKQIVRLGYKYQFKPKKHHVDGPLEAFIVSNVSKCTYHGDKNKMPRPIAGKMEEIKKSWPCAPLKINDDEYRVLQWTLNDTTHTQNEVLARQTSECPQNISSAEYIQFGSLRADGHRSQIRNLCASITSRALPFEKESVLSLVMQTLWECEINGSDGPIVRESHIDFSDEEFCLAMLEEITKYAMEQESNWMHPFKTLMVVVIAVRIFELNDKSDSRPVVDQVVKLLNKIRAIAYDWIEKIKKIIDDVNTPVNESNELRLKQIDVSIIGCLTFFVHPKHQHFEAILESNNNQTAPQQWLHFIITCKRNTEFLNNNNVTKLSSNLRMFLRLIDRIGIDLASKMKEHIQLDFNQVHDVIRKQWPNCGQLGTVNFHSKFTELLLIDCGEEQKVSIDIITGSFLVNGFPLSRLPSNILKSDVYKRIFGDLSFEVRPHSQNGSLTVKKYNNCSYEFRKGEKNIIIIERYDENIEKELILHGKFAGKFPKPLIENYSHWWNKIERCIEFRQRGSSGQRYFSNKPIIDYRLDLNTKHLTHVKTGRHLLDINSDSHEKLMKQLERLEHPNYMIMYLEQTGNVTIELPRMKLKFKVVSLGQEFQLESNEFGGMRVSCQQNIGTLYGLNHGLILENNEESSKILLIPNGEVKSEYIEEEQRVSVDIDFVDGKQNPPFYKYKVDNICRQLKSSDGSYASWIYLAYLHAVTSHGQIEPLTGMSGTERALQILQSAYVWSPAPYEPEVFELLEKIAQLSPIRKVAKQSKIQSVKWPRCIPSHAAQDTFVIIVNKLIQDSNRLHELYSKNPPQELNIEPDLPCNEHDYHRCLQLQPNLRVNDDFIETKVLRTTIQKAVNFEFSPNTQLVSILYHTNQYQLPMNPKFFEEILIQKHESLNGLQNNYVDTISKLLRHEEYNDFADIWFNLYEIARTKKCSDEEFTLALSLLAHRNEDLDPILALQAIARNSDQFRDIEPPKMAEFNISAGTYSAERVKQELEKHFSKECATSSTVMTSIIDDLGKVIEKSWPCSVEFSKRPRFPQYAKNYDYSSANMAINKLLASWFARSELDKFIQNIQDRLSNLNGCSKLPEVPEYDPIDLPGPKIWSKFNIDVESKICDSLNVKKNKKIAEQALNVWKTADLKRTRRFKTANDWKIVIECILNPDKSTHLIEASLFPRTVPSILLPMITNSNTNEHLKALIGAWAMTIAHEQRKARIEKYENRPDCKPDLDREMENKPHVNWKPCDRPEWLIFEIEQNLTIRQIQVKVANQMMDPPKQTANDATHSVMQLNMGEGKTTVVIPMLASVLSNGDHVCQITVPKPLLKMNSKLLRYYLGGMLNQPIYALPCWRDLPITDHIQQIQQILEECKMKKGVILTQPDYRLSFQLKLYESIKKHDAAAVDHLHTYQWLNDNVRNILDESDAILQPNHQLIYTMGDKLAPDGGEQRWKVIQAVLKRVPYRMKELYDVWNNNKTNQMGAPVEIVDENFVMSDDIFTIDSIVQRTKFKESRILDEKVFDELKSALADDFLDGKLDIVLPEIDMDTKEKLKDLLTIGIQESSKVLQQFVDDDKNKIRIFSGLLRFEVLKLALTKRWRVNYGVDPSGQRKMAVPFKAKDCPADMSEFGHPDVAICLTQLSYYYSGLTNDELYQLFSILESKKDAHSIYHSWFRTPRGPIKIPALISTYSGVNLDDPNQCKIAFSLLRYNMYAIDFYLSNAVYSPELKVFNKKLMCTAWDLCSDQLQHVVTGFSGTNDTKDILPLTVTQNDLPELEKTNEEMRQKILNNQTEKLEEYTRINFDGKRIIETLVEKKVQVLLDSGALMLDLSNKEVAIEWLKLVPESEFAAAVYFDSNDVLQTIDRDGIVTEFDCSVYRDNLSRCVTYLDDVHTRGTDLKFPLDWVACVTLSGDITRDKVMQSCMRMRQLGQNQKVYFWASKEADVRLRKVCNLTKNDRVTMEHVIEFICHNSRQFEQKNMNHWTANAVNFIKKRIAHMQYGTPSSDTDLMRNLYEACVDNESINLEQTYNGNKKQEKLFDFAWKHVQETLKGEYRTNQEIVSLVHKMQQRVYTKLINQAPEIWKFSTSYDEEQQRELEEEEDELQQVDELEQEFSEERHSERLLSIVPAQPVFNDKFQWIVDNGVTDTDVDQMKSRKLLYSISESFSNTKLDRFCKNNKKAWAPNLFVSKDFKTVIDGEYNTKHGDYLRPVMWIARIEYKDDAEKEIFIHLSPYERNRLLQSFQKSNKSTLMMYQPKLSKSHKNLLHDHRLHVTGQQSSKQIDINIEIQFGILAASMYFNTTAEQNAFCNFIGVIPQPRNEIFEQIHEDIFLPQSKGFVSVMHRKLSQDIFDLVGKCGFNENPTDFILELIKARHQTLQKDSHVASILEHGKKSEIIEDTNHNDDDDDDPME